MADHMTKPARLVPSLTYAELMALAPCKEAVDRMVAAIGSQWKCSISAAKAREKTDVETATLKAIEAGTYSAPWVDETIKAKGGL